MRRPFHERAPVAFVWECLSNAPLSALCVTSGGHRGNAMAVFKIVLIKPSHYDADGYVIQWWRSTIPSNSLASVYGLLTECADAQVLGPDVDIEIDAYDECNTVIDVKGTIAQNPRGGRGFRRPGRRAIEPVSARARSRARSSARPAFPVVIGGFHVSRLHLDAAQASRRPAGSARPRRDAVRRRRRRPHGGAAARHPSTEPRSRSTIISPTCPTWRPRRLPILPRPHRDARRRATIRASMPGAAARSSAPSAPSSTCRAASRATARRTTSRRSSAPTPSRASRTSSSPTTTSPATRTGSRSSTG